MSIRESGEMYLESIHVLLSRSKQVRAIDVAEYTGYKKPSVSRALGILRDGGYIVTDAEGYLSLTPAGEELAAKTYERHKVLTEYFMSLGVSEETAAADACRVEHVISDETFEAMKNKLNK